MVTAMVRDVYMRVMQMPSRVGDMHANCGQMHYGSRCMHVMQMPLWEARAVDVHTTVVKRRHDEFSYCQSFATIHAVHGWARLALHSILHMSV